MSRFFINRPIVAIVIAILTVIVGAITVVSLPVSQFPSIAPPEVQVSTPVFDLVRDYEAAWRPALRGAGLPDGSRSTRCVTSPRRHCSPKVRR